MLVRPRDLAVRKSVQQREIFTLLLDAARLKVRQILDQYPAGDFRPIAENWRQLSDGQIEFTMRRLPIAD
jgi:hypothetical protein